MTNQEVIDRLNDLIKIDIDAAEAYKQALKHIDEPEVFQVITQFRGDHLRHVTELSAMVHSLGGIPAEPKPDLKGYFLEGFTALRSMTGIEGALKAMHSNEKITTSSYELALHENLSPEALALVQRNYADEARHLSQIQRLLETKPWKIKALV